MTALPRALSRPGSPGNVLKSIQKFCSARARARKKRAQPPTSLGVASPDLASPATPPAAERTRPAASSSPASPSAG